MDSSVYRHLLGQFKKNCGIAHHNFPCHNLLSLDNLLEISKDFNDDVATCETVDFANFPCYYKSFPYVVQRSFVFFCGSGVADNALELVKKKLNWEKKLSRNLRVYDINLAIRSIKKLRENKDVQLTEDLIQFIDHFHSDPEPKFTGNYNWLYTGGCLSCNEDFDGTILISADFFAKKPGFNLLKLNDTLDKVQFSSFSQLKAHSPVLQITSRSQSGNLIFCVRQKNFLNLFNISETNFLSQPVKLWRKKVLGSKILTCTDIKADCDEVIVTDSNHDINIFHTERRNKIYGLSGKKSKLHSNGDSWSQVAYGDLGIHWACRNHFVILDMRDLRSGAKLRFAPSSSTNGCEEISSFVRSSIDSNSVYLSTTHNVLQVDLREGKPVQRWTHLMKSPPQFVTSIKDDSENEILVLQSQSVEEISGIVNERVKHGLKDSFLSRSLPCLLKSIKESLKMARFRGVCLGPSIAKRVDFSVTGMHGLKNSEGEINLFTHNSAGDIFLSKIQTKTSNSFLTEESEREVVDTMRLYESHLGKFPFKDSVQTHLKLTNMKHVLRDLKSSKAKAKLYKKPETYWKYHETYSPESMEYYRDVLAQKILRVWGHQCEDSTDIDDETLSVSDKVREWMEKC